MKNNRQILTGAAIASLVVITTLAQDASRKLPPIVDPQDSSAAQLDPSRRQLTITGRTDRFGWAEKASKVIGMEVKNTQNEKLGKVDDLAIDLASGRVVQVILSIGGFLGIGDTLVAVPPGALHYDSANKVIHLDADKEKLKAAPRFESAKWDDYSQPAHVAEVYAYYGQQPYFSATAESSQTGVAARTTDANQTTRSGARPGYLQKGSKLIGMSVKNLQDEKVGKVDNLIVDLAAGRIVSVVVSSGGFLGLGDALSAVPPMALRYNDQRDTILLDTTKEALAKNPHFNANQWPDMADTSYSDEVYRAYRVEPYFKRDTAANTTTPDLKVEGTVRNDVDNTRQNVRDRNNQTLTPGDQGKNSSDLEITRQIRKEIIAAKELSGSAHNVKIITTNGRVTLRGPVKTEEEKRVITEIASRIAQPANVDNQLEVKLTPTGAN